MKRWIKSAVSLVLAAALVLISVPAQGFAAALVPQGKWTAVEQRAAESSQPLATDEAVEQFLLSNGNNQAKGLTFNAKSIDVNGLQLIRKWVTAEGKTNYIYQQLYNDVPVYGKYAKVRLDGGRRPVFVDNDLALELGSRQITTAPAISQQQAIHALVRDVELTKGISIDVNATLFGKPAFYGEATKVLYPVAGEHRLAWQVTVSYLKPEPGSWTGFVDAVSGLVIDKYDKLDTLQKKNGVNGSGKGNLVEYGVGKPAGPLQAYYDMEKEIDPSSDDYYLLDVSRDMFDENTDEGVIVTYITDTEKETEIEWDRTYWVYNADAPVFEVFPDAVDAHYLTGEVYEFFRQEYGWNSVDGKGATVTNIVYFPVNDNAFWISGLNVIGYGTADIYACISCSGDIVAHEFAHGVVDYATNGLAYRHQSGSLHEAFADIFAAVFSRDNDPWVIGGDEINYVVRALSNPWDFGYPWHMNGYVHYDLSYDNGGVHFNSTIPSHAGYLIARGVENDADLKDALLELDEFDTNLIVGTDPVGRKVLGQIAFRALQYLTGEDQFQDARNAFVLAAEDYAAELKLDNEDADKLIAIVEEAWKEVGFPGTVDLRIYGVELPYHTYLLPVIDHTNKEVYLPVPANLPYDQLKVDVITYNRAYVEPAIPEFDQKGEAVVKIVNALDKNDFAEWTLRAVSLPILVYSPEKFEESAANDGSIGNAIIAELVGDKFTGANGEDLIASGKVRFISVPAGLQPKATKLSDTKVEIALTGRATNHAAKDSLDGLVVVFEKDAFQYFVDYPYDPIEVIFNHIAFFPVLFADAAPAPTPDPTPSPGPSPSPSPGPGPAPAPGPGGGAPSGFGGNESGTKADATDDGVVIDASNVQSVTDNGRTKIAVDLDEKALADAFRLLADNKDKPQTVIIPLETNADAYEVSFQASALVQGLLTAGNGASLSFRAGDVTYEVPLAAINPQQLVETLQTVKAGDVKITVSINRVTGETRLALTNRASETRMRVIGNAYEYQIKASAGSNSTEINRFARPVTRTMTLDGNHVNRTAVVRFDPESGKFTYVPAKFTYADGKTTVTFTRNTNSIYAVVQYTPIFADLTNHWAQDDIERLLLRGVVSGISADAFQPNGRVTRAQFAAMLTNALELEAEVTDVSFADVSPNAWHATPIAAGVKAGLFSGYPDGTFRPNDPISREQMAVMLAKAMTIAGTAAPAAGGNTQAAPFKDQEAISGWASDAVEKAVRAGLLYGKSDGRFAPQDPATRAEAAAIVARLLNMIEN